MHMCESLTSSYSIPAMRLLDVGAIAGSIRRYLHIRYSCTLSLD
jgi:hypothetical protein